MSPTASIRTAALLVTAALVLPAAAGAQAPSPDRTIVALGTGQADVEPTDRNDNASIVAAVEQAEDQALPLAVTEGREYAAKLATAAGVQLGGLVSISNAVPQNPYYGAFGPFGTSGTFGPGKFCGNVRRAIIRRDANGRRRRTGFRTTRVCRIPDRVIVQVTLTFAMA